MEEVQRLSGRAGVVGYSVVRGKRIRLRLELSRRFPAILPSVFLEPWDALGFIPHIGKDGKICYVADDDGLVVDRRRPLDLLTTAHKHAVGVLRRRGSDETADSFAQEFESYWALLDELTTIVSLVESDERMRTIIWAQANKSSDRKSCLAENEAQIERYLSGQKVGGDYTVRNALYVPLKREARITPPRHDRPFWGISKLQSIVWKNIHNNDKKKLWRLSNKCSSQNGIILLGLPKPDGTRSLVGLSFTHNDKGHPLIKGSSIEALQPIYISRRDQGFLVPRGGGNENLSEKSVLIVGCGAVGGRLAFGLAQAGILRLTLVDPDKLLPENTFRHVLGRLAWGKDKVRALKTMLELQMPYMRLEAINGSIESALAAGTVDIADFDLVIFATGSPTTELEMNERVCLSLNSPPAIHTWLEPYGIGGHALLAGNAHEGACFECLYQDPDHGPPYNRASFAAPGQSFGKTVSGCGSLFTPYGAADATRTSNLAVRLAVDVLIGREKRNPLLSWKGRSDAFEAAGFELSHRYAQTEQQLYDLRYAFAAADCPVCQKVSSNGEVEGQ